MYLQKCINMRRHAINISTKRLVISLMCLKISSLPCPDTVYVKTFLARFYKTFMYSCRGEIKDVLCINIASLQGGFLSELLFKV